MTWWKAFSGDTIRQIDLLGGRPPLAAVWLDRYRAAFHDLKDGKPRDTLTFRPPAETDRRRDEWQTYVSGLKAPNGVYLPRMDAGRTTIHTSDDGQMRLYQIGDAELVLEAEGREAKLDFAAERLSAVALDRALGTVAALDETGRLHLYQQNIAIGKFDLGLSLQDAAPALSIAQGGSAIIASDGAQFVHVNPGGQVVKRAETHYLIGLMACSPNGALIAAADIDSGVIRVYSGSDLSPLHQRFALDLLQKTQLTQDKTLGETPTSAALSALAINSAGVIAFALSDVLCVSDVTQMDTLPRPRRLL